MIFDIFLKITIPIVIIFVKKLKNNVKGEFVKIKNLTQVIVFVIFSQNWQFRLEIKILNFLGIQPS